MSGSLQANAACHPAAVPGLLCHQDRRPPRAAAPTRCSHAATDPTRRQELQVRRGIMDSRAYLFGHLAT